jgi:hypothetical protein
VLIYRAHVRAHVQPIRGQSGSSRAGPEAYLWPGISPAVRTYFAEITLMIKAAGQIAARIYPNGVSRGT